MNPNLSKLITHCLDAIRYATPDDIQHWIRQEVNKEWSVEQIEAELKRSQNHFSIVAHISYTEGIEKDYQTFWGLDMNEFK